MADHIERPAAFLASRLHRLDWTPPKPRTATTRHQVAKPAATPAIADGQPCSRNAGRAALKGAGHAAARAEAIRLARRAAQRRTAPRRQRQRLSTPRSGAPALATLSSRRCGDHLPTLCQPNLLLHNLLHPYVLYYPLPTTVFPPNLATYTFSVPPTPTSPTPQSN